MCGLILLGAEILHHLGNALLYGNSNRHAGAPTGVAIK
jgi:hypothetical protein